MASRSLGTLTLDLIARVGAFEQGMDKAERRARKSAKGIKESAEEASSAWAGLGKVAAGAFAGLSVGGLFTRFITETRNAEQEQAQLAAVLRSTGEAAGFTQDQLNSMASSMEGSSIISAGEFSQAQTALLAFTGIIGDQFPRALQAAADMSARTGMTVTAAAETIGRALDVPSQGMASLSRQGFRFTEDQKKLVQALESTGRTAEAQGVILRALEESYGGAAEAARNTLTGALAGLQNTISGLLTSEDGLPAVTSAVNSVSDALSSPAAKNALNALAAAAVAAGAVMTARLAGGAAASAAGFVMAQREAIRYQAALAGMAGVSQRAAIGITAAGTAASAASGAMALMGGPVGAAILAATAITWFATRSNDAEKAAQGLDERISKLDGSFSQLGKRQAASALLDYKKKLEDAEMQAATTAARVFTLNDNISRFPGSRKLQEWQQDLVIASGNAETAEKSVESLKTNIAQLNAIINEAPLSGVAGEISTAYSELSGKISEQLLLVGKRTEAERLAARVSAGLIEGLKEGEGDLLIAEQRRLDAALTADQARQASAQRTSQEAESAARAIEQQVSSLEDQAAVIGMTSEALAEYRLQQAGASDADIARARAAVRAVDAYKLQAEAVKALSEAEEGTNRDAVAIIESLQTEEEAIKQSYERRRQIIVEASLLTEQDKNAALLALQEEHDEQMLQVNGSYWEKYLAAAEDNLQNFDELSGVMLENFTGRFGDAFESMIFDAQSLGDAALGMAEGMARSVINALGQMAAQWLAYQAVQLLVGKTTQASAASTMTFNAMASQQMAGLNAFASTAAIPIVGPVMAPAAMTAAIAATSPMVGAVASLSLAGMAHEGIDAIPQTGTWLLEKGERVTTAETSAKLDKTLSDIQSGKGSGEVNVNFIEDASKAGTVETRREPDGTLTVDGFISNLMGDGKIKQAIGQKFGLAGVGR